MSGNSILPETSTGSSESPIESEQNLYGLKVKDLVDILYPVGSVYISFEETNPSEIMGGSWERVSEVKTLVGVDEDDTSFNVPNKTGGSKSINLAHSHTVNSHTHTTKDHTLTVDEIPSHRHTIDLENQDASSPGYGISITENNVKAGYSSSYMGFTGGGQPHNHEETTASSPGTNSKLSSSQSILNPYITVYMWKRVS